MNINLYNRDSEGEERYIFPSDIFSVEGYDPAHIEECVMLERYVEEKLKTFHIERGESVNIYINKGLNFALVAALNVFSRHDLIVDVCYYNRETEEYLSQTIEPAHNISKDVALCTEEVQLIAGRHGLELEAIYDGNCLGKFGVKKELLFDFDRLEEEAELKIQKIQSNTIKLYSTGMSQCLVSVIKMCRKLNKRLIIMHYNASEGTYFEQECV